MSLRKRKPAQGKTHGTPLPLPESVNFGVSSGPPCPEMYLLRFMSGSWAVAAGPLAGE